MNALPRWDAFEKALASALSVLSEESLVVSAGARNRFVQFYVCPVEGVRCETVSNAYLGPTDKLDAEQVAALLALGWAAPTHAPDAPAPESDPQGSPNFFREFPNPPACAEIARLAVRTLTEVHRIPSPDDLVYKAFDDLGHDVTLPALPIDPAPPPRAKAPPAPVQAAAFTKLRARVLAAARTGSGLGELAYGDGGALQVPIGSRTGWIRPCQRPFFVRVHLQLLAGVEGDEELVARMHEVNGRLPMARVIYQGGSVFLGVDFPAVPFRPDHLAQAIATLAHVADDVLADLRHSPAIASRGRG